MEDQQARQAITDLTNNMQVQLNSITEHWEKAMGEYSGTLERIFTDIGTKILMMDEALGHVATRLDQIEQVMGLENPTKSIDTTAKED